MTRLRYEKKYLVPNVMLSKLRDRFAPFLEADKYSDSQKANPEYTVRSIYFDSYSSNSFFEKIEGLKDRKKMRIRGYGYPKGNTKIVLEIKRKLEDRVMKNRAFIPFHQLGDLLKTGNLDACFGPTTTPKKEDASRFLYNIKRYNLRPQNLIVYDREAYHGKFDPGVRITFDKNIRYRAIPKLEQLFSDFGLTRAWIGYFILEVKYFDGEMPSWAKSIIEEFELKHEALSKYAKSVEESL
ncbi:VTC domain-containing protein [Belliella marina]|uniref:VTC domain-containing protein n=1 Tax=Belliella marina TaxID=1644146 RepID=A0ABW4VKK9_9BACT